MPPAARLGGLIDSRRFQSSATLSFASPQRAAFWAMVMAAAVDARVAHIQTFGG